MKKFTLILFICLIAFGASAQNTRRRVNFKLLGRDSVNLPLNDGYFLVEDSCAQITRYGHFDVKQRKFKGKFTDVSTANPNLVVAQGFYTDNGLKNGLFTTWYLNGKLQAKGNFKDDKYDGYWEVYYDSGLPELTFDITDGICRITDAWDAKGNKTVDKGSGTYTYSLGKFYWTGKLLNGKPDGTWRFINSEDVTGSVMATEHFKKGKFKEGSNKYSGYADTTHINLNVPVVLPFANAEVLKLSPVACDGSISKHTIINAQYPEGRVDFSHYISKTVSPYFSRMNLAGIEVTFEINGEISEKGDLVNLKIGDSNGIGALRNIIVELEGMPALQPATVDGKPVPQAFTITFKIHNGYYRFNYKFHRIKVD